MADPVLRVVLYKRHLGDLTQSREGGERRLRYRAGETATALSLSMPVAGVAYGRRQVEPFLLGLLPDSPVALTALGRRFDVSGRNPFALLQHVGLDCAGAVQFARTEDLELALSSTGELEPLDEQGIGARLRRLREQPGDWIATGEHWSLAGAQEKFALRRVDERWFSPSGAEPTTHIIKPGIAGLRAQALNEHLCLDALRRAGLRAVRSEYVEFDAEPAIVVERYDRRQQSDGTVLRIHQEDLCQSLSVYPQHKYESEGGPTATQIVSLLRASNATPDSIDRFVDALAANYLLGAPDAHAKNYSVLLVGDRVELAPLYDVASSFPYEAERRSSLRRVSMKIGGENEFGRIEGRHWRRFAERAALDPDAVRSRVRELATILPDALRDAITAAGPAASELGGRLLAPVADNCRAALGSLVADRTSSISVDPGTDESPPPSGDDAEVSGGGRWVEPHTRSGRPVDGYWRSLPGG
ncbi:MAG: type II toxin-antitoxin system HipA family toxin [Beutenbergiaceae bacterium]